MGDCTLDKDAYKKVIADDIELVEKYVPKTFMLKEHIITVLRWSIDKAYPPEYWDKKNDGPAYTCSDLLPDGFVFSASGRVILDPTKYPKED